MIAKFLKGYLETTATALTCPYSPLTSGSSPTKIYLDNIPTNAANNVISIHEVPTTNQRPTFWNGQTNPPEVSASTILLFIRSKMSSDAVSTALSDGDYANVLQTAVALRDAVNRISQATYSDANGSYVIDQIRPVSGAAFDHQDQQGRNLYLIRFEATYTWLSSV